MLAQLSFILQQRLCVSWLTGSLMIITLHDFDFQSVLSASMFENCIIYMYVNQCVEWSSPDP